MTVSPTAKVKSPAHLAHVVLRTYQGQAMIDFYKTFLGAEIRFQNDIICFLTYDEEHHRIAIANLPGTVKKDPKAAGMHHMAFTFATLDDLVAAYEQRKAIGIVPKWCVNHGPTTSMYYEDPDGNFIETQVDNFDTNEEANAYMSSPLFAQNPIGVDFDPDELSKRVRSGESHESIKKVADIGPRLVPPII